MDGIAASDALMAEWLSTYEKQRSVIWDQLIQLNTHIFITEKIEMFPFHIFLPVYDDRIFWHLTRNAYIEKIIMIISRVATDEGSLTIKYFRTEIMKHLRNDTLKSQLRATLKNVDFDNRIEKLSFKIKHARNNYLAHLDPVMNTEHDPKKIAEFAISLSEIKEILSIMVELFDVLCFEAHHGLWFWGYSGNARERNDTDIDNLLDSIAKHSPVLNMPEQEPEFWEMQRDSYTTSDLAVLTKFRRKFGLTDIL